MSSMTPPAGAVLELEALSVASPQRTLVHDCTLSVARGEAVGLVGESGSGKTLSVRAVAGLLPDGFDIGGTVRLFGEDLSRLSPRDLRELRATRVGMVFQTPRAYLNPLRSIGQFMVEAMVTVGGVKPETARQRAMELLEEVGITDPARRMRQYPAELSGGLLQRVMIAATLAMDPELLLADEITTALDVTTQEEVMAVIGDLRKHRELSLLFITHDLALAGAVTDRVVVMQQGRTIETLRSANMRADATQPYTKLLMSAALDGGVPGDEFGAKNEPVLSVAGLQKSYRVLGATGRRERLIAVEDVSFELLRGGSLGIVGESGSGKSTSAKIVCGLERADAGAVTVFGENWSAPARGTAARRARAKKVQMVFQDPYQSLDRRQTVRQALVEALRVHTRGSSANQLGGRVSELASMVGLDSELLEVRPRALSGGQRQRVAIARALAAEPEILVLDEAVSALDVTTQVEILELLDSIRRETGVSLLMITHDLTVIRRLCDRVVVMRSGRVEEQGETAAVLDAPSSDYTRILLDSIPHEGWVPKRRLGATRAVPVITEVLAVQDQREFE